MVATKKLVPKESLPTKGEIRAKIPAHCFEHSAPRALALVLRDGLVIGAFGYAAKSCLRSSSMRWFDLVGWLVYAFFQGTAMTGWWVLAHECGHGGFSHSTLLNDLVGFVLHSALLVPYFSWQYSHAKHHAKTNHLMDGETHNPDLKDAYIDSGYLTLGEALGEEGFAGFKLVSQLVFGWPMYLLTNVSGARRTYDGAKIESNLDHFRPSSKLFPPSWHRRIFASSCGIFATLSALSYATYEFGFVNVALYYWGPYLWTNFWLVLYTWLQHTDENVPHYGDDEWTWVRGALSTIDRPYSELGGFFDWIHHHIGSTHVAHHLFSNLPCYHAVEATAHVKSFLEPKGLYNYDGRPLVHAMWTTAKHCHYVEAEHGVQYPRSIFKHISKKSS